MSVRFLNTTNDFSTLSLPIIHEVITY